MKKTMALMLMLLVALSGTVLAGAWDDAVGTYEDTSYFDGGSGSTINTYGSYSSYDVPDIEDAGPIGYQDEDGNYHSY